MQETTNSPEQNDASASRKVPPNRQKKEQTSVESVQPIIVQSVDDNQPRASAVITPTTKFWLGQWAHKSNESDPNDVTLSVQGETIRFQRGVDCVVPEPYLEVARHATYPKFKQEPGKGRKVASYISRFPFTTKREATYDEFRKGYEEGSDKTRKAVAQHGLQIPVEESVPQLQ